MSRSLAWLPLPLTLVAFSSAAADTQIAGQTDGGAYYRIVVPEDWNGDLVIWNHGFSLDPIEAVTDTGPLSLIQLPDGFAVAASSYSQSGWALFESNRDLEKLVGVFETEFGVPERIILYGASLGGAVSASAIESAELGNVVGALTFCGAMAGSRNWDAAVDLRLIYDLYCKKGKIPGGARGLPKRSGWTEADVAAAVNECTGVDLPQSQRTKKQNKALKKIRKATRLPNEFLVTDMEFATLGLSDLVFDKGKLGGKIGAGNAGVVYGIGKVDRKIERVEPNDRAEEKLGENYTPSGRVGDVKIVSIHTDKDGLVIVENQSEYASVVPADNLTTAIVVEKEPSHCGFEIGEVVAAWEALLNWLDTGEQPTAADLQADCELVATIFGGSCRIDPSFVVPDMDRRIRPR